MMVQVILFLVILHADLLAGAACTFAVFIWLAMQACPKRAAIAAAIIMILVSVGRHLLILRHIDDLKRSC